MHLLLKYPLYKGESRTGCVVFRMLEGKPIISEKITSSVSAQLWFGFSFYLEIVMQPVNRTEQSVQLVCHLAGFRLQLTFQIKKSSYTIKIVLVKRLTRRNSKGEFTTGWLLLRLVIKPVCVWLWVFLCTHLQTELFPPRPNTEHSWYCSTVCAVGNYQMHYISNSSFPTAPFFNCSELSMSNSSEAEILQKAITAQKQWVSKI